MANGGAARVIYNAMHRMNSRIGLRATAWEVSNATRRVGDVCRLIISYSLRGYVRAVRAVRNTLEFQRETGVVADESVVVGLLPGQYINLGFFNQVRTGRCFKLCGSNKFGSNSVFEF
jgi:hypothetical protein